MNGSRMRPTVNPRDGSVHALESERFEVFKHTELVPSSYFSLASLPFICQELHIFGHLCLPESPGPLQGAIIARGESERAGDEQATNIDLNLDGVDFPDLDKLEEQDPILKIDDLDDFDRFKLPDIE